MAIWWSMIAETYRLCHLTLKVNNRAELEKVALQAFDGSIEGHLFEEFIRSTISCVFFQPFEDPDVLLLGKSGTKPCDRLNPSAVDVSKIFRIRKHSLNSSSIDDLHAIPPHLLVLNHNSQERQLCSPNERCVGVFPALHGANRLSLGRLRLRLS